MKTKYGIKYNGEELLVHKKDKTPLQFDSIKEAEQCIAVNFGCFQDLFEVVALERN